MNSKDIKVKQGKTMQNTTSRFRKIQGYTEDYLFMLPYLIIFFVFTVLPVIIAIILSFTYFNVLETPSFVGFDNYVHLLVEDSLFMLAFKNTLILSVITGPIGFLLSLFLAWVLNEFNPKLRAFLTLLFYAPTISGGAYMIWQIIYSGDSYGYLNGILLNLNIIYSPIQWTTDEKYMMFSAIVVIIWMSFGAGFLSFVAGFRNIDKSLYEAAAVDGLKNRWQELWFITLPNMKPMLMFGAVMSITQAFGVCDVTMALCGYPSTDYAARTIVTHLFDYGFSRFEMGYACAIATVLFLIMILCNKAIQNLLSRVGT